MSWRWSAEVTGSWTCSPCGRYACHFEIWRGVCIFLMSRVAGGWGGFLHEFESLLTRELVAQYPEFIRALRQLERDSRLEQERQSAQVLATLRLKDKRIAELQKAVDEQQEQLDVLLDELERRVATKDAETQAMQEAGSEREKEMAESSAQTETTEALRRDAEAQTVPQEESGVLLGLERLEAELKRLEERNRALEMQLQSRLPSEETEQTEECAHIEACMEILQQGVEAMNLSCSCVTNPLALFSGTPSAEDRSDKSGEELGRSSVSACVNLEHRLESQAIRLEHVSECLHLWRESTVRLLKRKDGSDKAVMPSLPPDTTEQHDLRCFGALRGALEQIRHYLFQRRATLSHNGERNLKELARVLASGKSGTKTAAKLVQKWAGWEASHLEEVRALRQGFAEERAVALSRRTALLKQIDTLEQQQLDLEAEVNALKRSSVQTSKATAVFLPVDQASILPYPELLLRLSTVEQSLLAKEEQLKTANDTIYALSGSTSAASPSPLLNPSAAANQLAVQLQRPAQEKVEFYQRRENHLVNLGQYFQMEKQCLLLKARLEAEQKRAALLEAATVVSDRERDDLCMKFEKLETEKMLATVHGNPRGSFEWAASDSAEEFTESSHDLLFLALKRQGLLEKTIHDLRMQLRHSLQQNVLMQRQREHDGQERAPSEQVRLFDSVAQHHQVCVREFKALNGVRESSTQAPSLATEQPSEYGVLLHHYEALWMAFHACFSLVNDSPCTPDPKIADGRTPNLELVQQKEKVLLLQQALIHREEQLRRCRCSTGSARLQHETLLPSKSMEELLSQGKHVDRRLVESIDIGEHPFLESRKPLSETVDAASQTTEVGELTMEGIKSIATTNMELQTCLAKCAELTAQNVKLSRRLRAEKESNKLRFKEQQELEKQLEAHTTVSSELLFNPSLAQTPSPVVRQGSPIRVHDLETVVASNTKPLDTQDDVRQPDPLAFVSPEEHEALREQLSSREQENLALVQSLCAIKEKYAQMEVTHQKELRSSAAEHTAKMDSYMTNVNETLSRIEHDKKCLEDECASLRSRLKALQDDMERLQLEKPQRTTTATNTDPPLATEPVDDSSSTVERLEARVQDLELQLTRERKLFEAVERNQQLENQHEGQQESKAQSEMTAVTADLEKRCNDLQEWRLKLQQEFTESQAVQKIALEENDNRIAFLSACVEEFARLASSAAPSGRKAVSTKELYDAVMALSKPSEGNPSRRNQAKYNQPTRKKVASKQRHANARQREAWLESSTEEAEPSEEMCEALWWKIRATKMEAYMHAATDQNDTFEETIQRLELRMNDAKQELAIRLTREAQLLATIASLKAEMAAVKEQAALLADKYQQASADLEKKESEVSNRGDESQRNKMAMQRKSELLSQQKAKVASLQTELEQATKKVERLAAAEKQAALLQQKAKENTQQLVHARQVFERCHEDNVQLSFHVDKMKERHAAVAARLKAARAENAQLRTQLGELKNTAKTESTQEATGRKVPDNQLNHGVSVASLTEEVRALKRRILQKQDVIVSYKAKVAELDGQLERQRETMVKLARSNRDLQQVQRQRQLQESESASLILSKLETQLEVKQEQLDGLRASVYDSFEAFVHCQSRSTNAPPLAEPVKSPLTNDLIDTEDKLLAVRRWTDFSPEDLNELKLARGSQQAKQKNAPKGVSHMKKKHAAIVALQEVEGALETNPEDCRAEICDLLQCICEQ